MNTTCQPKRSPSGRASDTFPQSTRYILNWIRADSHYTSRFRYVAERLRSVKFSYVYLNEDVHTDRNVSVTSQFRSVAAAERECLTWQNGSEAVCTCSIPSMWPVLRLLHYTTHSSEYSSGSPDEPVVQRNRVCDANSAPAQASKPAQMNSSTLSSVATYCQTFPSQLNM
jgi:hypothetical protein